MSQMYVFFSHLEQTFLQSDGSAPQGSAQKIPEETCEIAECGEACVQKYFRQGIIWIGREEVTDQNDGVGQTNSENDCREALAL